MDFYLNRKRTDDMMDEIISFSGEVRASDLIRLAFSPLDRTILHDETKSPADYLLALEIIFRRHAEQAPNASNEGPSLATVPLD